MQDTQTIAPPAQVAAAAPTPQGAAESFWPKGWWSIVDFKIGIIPLPVFLILLAVIGGFAATGTVPSDILLAILFLSMGDFPCSALRRRIPLSNSIGATVTC